MTSPAPGYPLPRQAGHAAHDLNSAISGASIPSTAWKKMRSTLASALVHFSCILLPLEEGNADAKLGKPGSD